MRSVVSILAVTLACCSAVACDNSDSAAPLSSGASPTQVGEREVLARVFPTAPQAEPSFFRSLVSRFASRS
jgi:hypothetical protein